MCELLRISDTGPEQQELKYQSAYRAQGRDSAKLGVGRAYGGTPGSLKLGVEYIVGTEMLD